MRTNTEIFFAIFCSCALAVAAGCSKTKKEEHPAPLATPIRIKYLDVTRPPGERNHAVIDNPDEVKSIVDEINLSVLITGNKADWFVMGEMELEYSDGRQSIVIGCFWDHVIAMNDPKGERQYYRVQEGGWFDKEEQKTRAQQNNPQAGN